MKLLPIVLAIVSLVIALLWVIVLIESLHGHLPTP